MIRNLTNEEIERLELKGCRAKNWDNVKTTLPLGNRLPKSLERITNVRFSGNIIFGSFEKSFVLPGGIEKNCGLHNVALHNVVIGDNCLIENVSNYIANYTIGEQTIIQNVDVIVTDGKSYFGNGVEVSVLNEVGGREVMIHNKLSAQLAYIVAMYRHRPLFIEKINSITKSYVESIASTSGSIGSKVTIRNTGSITGVYIGDNATVIGAGRLRNGSINSNAIAPVHIGYGVVAEDFIISSGSRIDDNTTIYQCFIGQACMLGSGYSASNSLFFSNCHGENGEACAIFAGPFTVTHHKSSLLIAGMFSFMNAGSGSNQSNHMYKLGPIHQGILERGSKTSSDSYILWPSRVGPFSLVMGRHVTHSDTTNLPFSYLIEQKNTTYCVPGVNLRSVGTIRDAQKWPNRDKRVDNEKLDFINYNLLSPYTIQKMFKGLELLKNLQYSSGVLSDIYSYHSTKITNKALRSGLKYYNTAIVKFLGNSIIKRLENIEKETDIETIHEILKPQLNVGYGLWVDIVGMIAPKSEIERVIMEIENGKNESIEQIISSFDYIHSNYYNFEWQWAHDKIEEYFNVNLETIEKGEIIEIVKKWEDAVIGLDRELYEDAKKEFNLASMTSFGADGGQDDKAKDFEQVRGVFDSNSFVKAVLEHIETKQKLGDSLIEKLS